MRQRWNLHNAFLPFHLSPSLFPIFCRNLQMVIQSFGGGSGGFFQPGLSPKRRNQLRNPETLLFSLRFSLLSWHTHKWPSFSFLSICTFLFCPCVDLLCRLISFCVHAQVCANAACHVQDLQLGTILKPTWWKWSQHHRSCFPVIWGDGTHRVFGMAMVGLPWFFLFSPKNFTKKCENNYIAGVPPASPSPFHFGCDIFSSTK